MSGAAVSRAPLSADELAPGVEVEVDIGAVAHGGHCVARFDGRVIFVRLALPGERAVVRITEAKRGSFCRGEVIRVLRADPRRIEAPCVHYHPGGCGGCDFQHADAGPAARAQGRHRRRAAVPVGRDRLARRGGTVAGQRVRLAQPGPLGARPRGSDRAARASGRTGSKGSTRPSRA